MAVVQHCGELFWLLVVTLGPAPFCLAAVRWSRGGERQPAAHDALVFAVCWCCVQTALGLALGMAHCLTPWAVRLGELVLFAVGVGAWRIRNNEWRMANSAWRMAKLSAVEWTMVLALALLGGALLWRIASRLALDYDTVAYHLPAMDLWYQTGGFAILDQFNLARMAPRDGKWDLLALISGMIGRYPYGWECLCSLFLLTFREDYLALFPNLWAWGVWGLSIYLLGLRAGAGRVYCLGAAALAMCVPDIVKNVTTLHVDLPFAAFFLAGVYFALTFHQRRCAACLTLALVSMGMLASIKTSGLIYGGLLVGWLALLEIGARLWPDAGAAPRLRRASARWAVGDPGGSLVLGVLVGAGLCGYWYIRNFVDCGNPLGCLRIELAGRTLFPGELDPGRLRKTMLAGLFELSSADDWRVLLGQIKLRLGAPFLALALLAALAAVDWLRRRRVIRPVRLLELALLLAPAVVLFWNSPYSADNGTNGWKITPWIGGALRYGFPALGLLAVLAAAGAAAVRLRGEILAGLTLLSCAAALVEIKLLNGALGAALVVFGLYQVLIAPRLRSASARQARLSDAAGRQARRCEDAEPARLREGEGGRARGLAALDWLAIGAGCLLVLLLGSFTAREARDNERRMIYSNMMGFLDRRLERGEPLGYMMSYLGHLFYGARLERPVYFVPGRTGESREQWLARLKKQGIATIALGPLLREEWRTRHELGWLTDPRGPFYLAHPGDWYRQTVIFRLKEADWKGEG